MGVWQLHSFAPNRLPALEAAGEFVELAQTGEALLVQSFQLRFDHLIGHRQVARDLDHYLIN